MAMHSREIRPFKIGGSEVNLYTKKLIVKYCLVSLQKVKTDVYTVHYAFNL
jgi:hypothetical protein